jgi:hypothetical protein
LADLDLGVLSGAGAADLFAVRAWIQPLERAVAGAGAGGDGDCGVSREPARGGARPYILRFDEDRPNPLYRRVCYTFAWSAAITFATLNLAGLVQACLTGRWFMADIYKYGYFPLCGVVLLLGALGKLPRVGPSTRYEGHERRYFYGTVWAVTVAQTILPVLWKAMPVNRETSAVKLVLYVGALAGMGLAARRGLLHRTKPILPGEDMVAD